MEAQMRTTLKFLVSFKPGVSIHGVYYVEIDNCPKREELY